MLFKYNKVCIWQKKKYKVRNKKQSSHNVTKKKQETATNNYA
jgi:hypothetical protein